MEKEKIMKIMQDKKVLRSLLTEIDYNPGRLKPIARGIEQGNVITDVYEAKAKGGKAYAITYVADGGKHEHICLFAKSIEASLDAYRGLGEHDVRFITLNGEGVEITGLPEIVHPFPLQIVMTMNEDNTILKTYTAEIGRAHV